MKRNYLVLIFILIGIALLSGKLTTGMSIIGDWGIGLFYHQLSFLKNWWQSTLVCLGAFLIIGIVLFVIDRMLDGIKRKLVLLLFFLLFIIGLYLTFLNFRTDITHRWMGERFHMGIYLYWIGAGIISLFFGLTEKKKIMKQPNE